MAVLFSPWGNQQFVDENGDPAAGWMLYTYEAGSSTQLATYTDSTGSTAQSNPIILNALGFPTNGEIWLVSGKAYKFVLANANDVVQKTENGITGVSSQTTDLSQWKQSGVTPTYISAVSFTLPGDQTSEFHVGRRVQLVVSAGTVYGTIDSSAYTTLTTVTMTMDSGQSLDAGLTTANLSILRADNSALPVSPNTGYVRKEGDSLSGAINESAGAAIASAATTNIWATDGNTVHVTGSTTITSFGAAPQAGAWRKIIFDGAPLLTQSANLNLNAGGGNIQIAAGDMAFVYADTATQLEVLVLRNSGGAINPIRQALYTSNGSFTVPAGVTKIYVSASAGGGGGGGGSTGAIYGGGGGGGAGETIMDVEYAVTPGQVIAITIGAGGAGSSSAAAAGGNTVIGSLVTLAGGGGGEAANTPGVATGKGGSYGGGNGAVAVVQPSSQGFGVGGVGGSGPFGTGGIGASVTPGGTALVAGIGTGYGSGGGGGASSIAGATSGANGRPGFVRIRY